MGDIKKQRKKFERPAHPWEAERIEVERGLMKEYGLGNKKELWKFRSLLRGFRQQAKSLIARESVQAEKEKKLLVEKLIKLGLVDKNAKLEDILGLDLKKLLDKRLQTQVLQMGLARTTRQARQFIVHGHVLVNNQKVNVPSYLLKLNDVISFSGTSTLSREDHPERIVEKKDKGKVIRIVKKKPKAEKTVDKMKEKKEVKEEKKPKVEKKVEKKKVEKTKEVKEK